MHFSAYDKVLLGDNSWQQTDVSKSSPGCPNLRAAFAANMCIHAALRSQRTCAGDVLVRTTSCPWWSSKTKGETNFQETLIRETTAAPKGPLTWFQALGGLARMFEASSLSRGSE
eukprot:9150312-Pyramimonas_sp.AAC.1